MRARLFAGRERGQALVLTTLFMTVVLGAAALSIDLGHLTSNKRQLQNGADAAALAGAWQLPTDSGAAQADAVTWALNNNLLMSEVTETTVFQTSQSDDTIRVSVQRDVPFIFGRVLGLNNQTLTATATAQVKVLNGITTGQPRAFPYAVWDGNPKKLKMGDSVTFRSNNYTGVNVDPSANCGKTKSNNCTWDVTGNNFKGYFHWQNGYKLYVKPTSQAFSQGGNAFGTDDAAALWQYYQSGTPVLLPVITWAHDPSGQELDFVITSFVCVQITQMDNEGSIDWVGTIVKCAGAGLTDGPYSPSITGAFVTSLTH